MADTTTLPLSQPKKEKINPSQVIGGLFEDVWENITGVNPTPQSFEAQEPIKTPVPEYLRTAFPDTPPSFEANEINDFQTPRRRKDVYPEQIAQLEQELYQAQLERIRRLPTEEKRTKINELNEIQSHYQGSVDNQGNVTIYHEANAERKQSENLAIQIQNEREQKLNQERGGPAVSTKGAIGPRADLTKRTDVYDGQSRVVGANTGQ